MAIEGSETARLFFDGGRKYKMNLQVVGALGVSLSGWRLELTRVSIGRAFKTLAGDWGSARSGGARKRHASGATKRERSEAAKAVEKAWRKSPNGRRLKLKNMAAHWASPKGKAARQRAGDLR